MLGIFASRFMGGVFVETIVPQDENKKPIWASDRFRPRERGGSSPLRVTHIRAFARSTVAAPGPVG
jgi:hypothetical protein